MKKLEEDTLVYLSFLAAITLLSIAGMITYVLTK